MSLRLFAAVELPDTVRAAAAAAAAPVLGGLRGARTVPVAQMHVTVRFLGDVDEADVGALRGALVAAIATCRRGDARLRGIGAFPGARDPRVVWVGVEDPDRVLAAMESAVTRAVAPFGIEPERRAFRPHVTVARIAAPRVRRPSAADDSRAAAVRRATTYAEPSAHRRATSDVEPSALRLPEPAAIGEPFPVRELTLFASELTPRGAVHRPLVRIPVPEGASPSAQASSVAVRERASREPGRAPKPRTRPVAADIPRRVPEEPHVPNV